jgi:hypothetical protein
MLLDDGKKANIFKEDFYSPNKIFFLVNIGKKISRIITNQVEVFRFGKEARNRL